MMAEPANPYLQDSLDRGQIVEEQAGNDEPIVERQFGAFQSSGVEARDDRERCEKCEDGTDGYRGPRSSCGEWSGRPDWFHLCYEASSRHAMVLRFSI